MIIHEITRETFNALFRGTKQPNDFIYRRRPTEMTDDQWAQFTDFVKGRAIPTDTKLLAALRLENSDRDPLARWFYTSVASTFVGEGYRKWEYMIQEQNPDMLMDIGL